jgi:hypothetical protein
LLTLLCGSVEAEIVKTIHGPPLAPTASVHDVVFQGGAAAISIFDTRADAKRRFRLVSRRRREAHVRSAGHVIGWIAGVTVLLLLALAGVVGLR